MNTGRATDFPQWDELHWATRRAIKRLMFLSFYVGVVLGVAIGWWLA